MTRRAFEGLEARVLFATFAVTSAADAGAGSLRAAITSANASPGADAIRFDIAPAGAQTIALSSPLPDVTEAVSIDGATQSGFADRPIVTIDGSGAGAGADGLGLASDGSTIRNLVITRFAGNGVRINGNDNQVGGVGIAHDHGNLISTNGGAGIFVESGAGNALMLNSIAGNAGRGIVLAPGGANETQPAPVITSAQSTGVGTWVSGTLQSTPFSNFHVEVFSSPDNGSTSQGRTPLGYFNVTTNGSGAADFTMFLKAFAEDARVITATATRAGPGSTSEFSVAVNGTFAEGAPTVASAAFRYSGVALPGAVHELTYIFSENVGGSLSTADLVVRNLTTGQTIAPNDIGMAYEPRFNRAQFNFGSFVNGILPDGRYEARLIGVGVTDETGVALDGDVNGTPGGDHVLRFQFLRGDFNNDGRVNLDDFNVLAANFGQPDRSYEQGDANYDGRVNLDDFNILASRFGNALPAAPSAAPARGSQPSRVLDSLDSSDEALT